MLGKAGAKVGEVSDVAAAGVLWAVLMNLGRAVVVGKAVVGCYSTSRTCHLITSLPLLPQHIFDLLIRLRQAVDHPYLVGRWYSSVTVFQFVHEVQSCKKITLTAH